MLRMMSGVNGLPVLITADELHQQDNTCLEPLGAVDEFTEHPEQCMDLVVVELRHDYLLKLEVFNFGDVAGPADDFAAAVVLPQVPQTQEAVVVLNADVLGQVGLARQQLL